MKKINTLLLVLFVFNATAQDSTKNTFGIITKKNFGPYKMDGTRISGQEFKEEIYKVPAAIPLYKKAKTSKILGYSFVAPIAFLAFFGNPNKDNSRDTVTGKTRLNSYHITLLLSEGASLYFLFRSFSLYKKAVRARNSSLKTIY